MSSASDLARLRRIWPAIVRAKGGNYPKEPIGVVTGGDGVAIVDGRWSDDTGCQMIDHAGFHYQDVPDLTLPGTRAAVLAWLGLPTVTSDIAETGPGMWDVMAEEHTAATALAALERWAKEHAG